MGSELGKEKKGQQVADQVLLDQADIYCFTRSPDDDLVLWTVGSCLNERQRTETTYLQ